MRFLRKIILLLGFQALVVALTGAGTASYIHLRTNAELISGVQDACLLTAQAVRNRLKSEGVENRILLVEYGLNSTTLRHVAVVFALEDGTLASFESLNALAGFSRGSISLGLSEWDAARIAERLPRQSGARVLAARWIDSLSYESTRADLATVAR